MFLSPGHAGSPMKPVVSRRLSLKLLPSVGVALCQTKPADTIHDFSFPVQCQTSVRTPTRHLTSWEFPLWPCDERLLELQRDNLWFPCSDSLLLQSVEPRDVLMDVQGWGSRETRGHLRGGRRGSQRDLQVSDQESSYHQHRSRPWINSPLLIRCPNIHYICHTCPAWLG